MKKILNVAVIVAMIFAWISVFVIPTSAQITEDVKPAYLVGKPDGLIMKNVQNDPCPPCPEKTLFPTPSSKPGVRKRVSAPANGDVIVNLTNNCCGSGVTGCALHNPALPVYSEYVESGIGGLPTWAFVILILTALVVAAILGYLIARHSMHSSHVHISKRSGSSSITRHSTGPNGQRNPPRLEKEMD